MGVHPNMPNMPQQVIDTINYTLDMRKKISKNMETVRTCANCIIAYGINYDESFLALTLLANIDMAAQHKWGREFCPALQAI
jgi:hypothetical protein